MAKKQCVHWVMVMTLIITIISKILQTDQQKTKITKKEKTTVTTLAITSL